MVDAREYHERTDHSPRSVRESDVRLDRSNKPRPYKVYENLPAVEPSGEPSPPPVPALAAVAQPAPVPVLDGEHSRDGNSDRSALDVHTLCRYAAGVTKTREQGGRELRFRAAACTGKLYHVDLYAVVGDVPGFDPGVYHYDPDGDAFDALREGDYRSHLAAAAGAADGGVADAPVTFVATSEWWRNAWKYRARTYRHAFWDSGTVLANLLAVAHAGGHHARVVTAFADDPVVRLLGVDPDDEAPLELVAVGGNPPSPAPPPGSGPDPDPVDPEPLEAIAPAEKPLSRDPVDYPLVPDAWRQSRLADGEAAREWRTTAAEADAAALGRRTPGDGERIALDPVDAETASARPVGETIERRGSLREYAHDPISDRLFATVLDRALRGVPTDVAAAVAADGATETAPDDSAAVTPDDSAAAAPGALVDAYCLVHAVEGIPSGAYQYHPEAGELERVGDTDRETAGHIALDQPVVGDAAVNVYLMADVDAVVEALGNRGYRLAQLEAGLSLGRLYLATYAHLALGGRGFTFYDDLVTDHLSPAAASQSPMTLFAFGRPPASRRG